MPINVMAASKEPAAQETLMTKSSRPVIVGDHIGEISPMNWEARG
ncbi:MULTISPECIES: hypothetical protein [Rhizobium]|uniref:Uncharacterized protein n=1 Tax=Rhizobium favelukesii TaxID=348824 RepID=W6RIR7_9HYPH|nr:MULTISPECIES: hypothetical protein [Rhizobium]CDM58758.1 hypothetical protein LPU83_3108 [Rhizobium favelukesii]